MEEVPNLINIGPTNPIQILNRHEFFGEYVCVVQIKYLDVVTGTPQQRQKVY